MSVWTPPCEYVINTTRRDIDTGEAEHTYACVRHGAIATATGAPCADNPLPPAPDIWQDVAGYDGVDD